MEYYTMTRYDRRKGRYEASCEVGTLAKVLVQARNIAAAAAYDVKVEVKIEMDDENKKPFSIAVTTRDSKGQLVTSFSAQHYTEEELPSSAIQTARQAHDIEVLKNFVLGES
jgi:hypothetical protein